MSLSIPILTLAALLDRESVVACGLFPNGRHTLEIVSNGDGDVSIEAVYVFQPPMNSE